MVDPHDIKIAAEDLVKAAEAVAAAKANMTALLTDGAIKHHVVTLPAAAQPKIQRLIAPRSEPRKERQTATIFARPKPSTPTENGERKPRVDTQAGVLSTLATGPKFFGEILQASGASKSGLYQCLSRLQTDKRIDQQDGKWRLL